MRPTEKIITAEQNEKNDRYKIHGLYTTEKIVQNQAKSLITDNPMCMNNVHNVRRNRAISVNNRRGHVA